MQAHNRRRRRWFLFATVPLVSAGVLAALPTGVHAQAPAKVGWWTAANSINGSPLTAPIGQVPQSDQLHVANGPSCSGTTASAPQASAPCDPTGNPGGPSAMSAMSYPISGGLPPGTPLGTVLGQLTMKVGPAPYNGPPAAVVACTILTPWNSVNGGEWPNHPSYRQGGCVPGQLSADGTTMTFTMVAALMNGDNLDIGLVPAIGNQSPFQIQFAPPDASSMALSSLSPASFDNSGSGTVAPLSPAGNAYAPSISGGSVSIPPVAAQPVVPPASTILPQASTGTRTTSGGGTSGLAAALKPDSTRQRIMALLLLVGLGAALVGALSGSRMRLLTAGAASPVGGIGRFARPRSTPPARL
jgi:hypothetical protein